MFAAPDIDTIDVRVGDRIEWADKKIIYIFAQTICACTIEQYK